MSRRKLIRGNPSDPVYYLITRKRNVTCLLTLYGETPAIDGIYNLFHMINHKINSPYI